MGGGRDNSGATKYKRVGGSYVRIGAYKDKEREASRLIDNYIANQSDVKPVLKYLKAIDERDRNIVLGLDKKLNNGDFGTGNTQTELSNIRKVLLDIARDNPDGVSRIHQQVKQKTGINLITKKDISKRVASLQAKYVGKKFRLKENIESWYGRYTPAGTEGTLVKVDAQIIHNTVFYNFVLKTDYGQFNLSERQIELVK